MLELGKLYIPTILSYDPERNKISFGRPEIHTPDYFKNIDYNLQLDLNGDQIIILYYGDDDTYLADALHLDYSYIASGNLSKEKFGKIQERALKVLGEYIVDSQRELIDLFNEEF